VILAGYRNDEPTARAALVSPQVPLRVAALGALDRLGTLTAADVNKALADQDCAVRRRACELAWRHPSVALVRLLDDDDLVVEAAAWALGERGEAQPEVVARLGLVASAHNEPLCREAAVAALGAIGHQAALSYILDATTDRPAIRRRAVIALANFDGPPVQAALARALEDRDWQVRQAAEDLITDRFGGPEPARDHVADPGPDPTQAPSED